MDNLLILVLTIVTGIYQLESSGGKFDSCLKKGLFNGYGYASNKICFKTHAEAQGVVASWVIRNYLAGLTIPQLLCKYQSGKPGRDCEYYRKYQTL